MDLYVHVALIVLCELENAFTDILESVDIERNHMHDRAMVSNSSSGSVKAEAYWSLSAPNSGRSILVYDTLSFDRGHQGLSAGRKMV